VISKSISSIKFVAVQVSDTTGDDKNYKCW
jgi:hypothetical protein